MTAANSKITYTAAEVAELIRPLTQSVEALQKENAELKRKLEHMNEVFANAQRARFGQSSEKKTYVLSEDQMSLFNEAESCQDHKAEEPAEETFTVKAHARKKKRTIDELAKNLPVEEIVIDLPESKLTCDKCGGTGYIGTNMCECLLELCRQEQKKEVSILSGSRDTFNQFRLDYYSDYTDSKYGASPRAIMERNLKVCRTYGLTFTPDAGNLLFVGGTGLGKTFLSACIARAVADRGCSVVYESAGHLFSKLEQARFNGNEETRAEAAKLTACDLLLLDDLGTEMPGQFVTSALYSLLNDRLLAGKPMVISTNLTVEELSRRYSPQITSRLRGSFSQLTFVGDDIRVMKNK